MVGWRESGLDGVIDGSGLSPDANEWTVDLMCSVIAASRIRTNQ